MKKVFLTVVALFAATVIFANEIPSIYNVVWDTPSKNATGTMPIGNGDKIYLFPAWVAKWDVDFKLHARNNTTIKATVKDGKIVSWSVTPKYREADVTICPLQ